jgi:steroid delta-isomerase-like uncharacterized protein
MSTVMTRADLQRIADQYLDAWTRRKPEAIARLFAEDAVAESPIYSTLRGRKAIEDAVRAFFTSFPDITWTDQAILIDPPNIAVFSIASATHVNEFFGLPGTGRRIEMKNSRLLKVNDEGLIVHERRIYDFTGLLVQIGVLRAKPAKP